MLKVQSCKRDNLAVGSLPYEDLKIVPFKTICFFIYLTAQFRLQPRRAVKSVENCFMIE